MGSSQPAGQLGGHNFCTIISSHTTHSEMSSVRTRAGGQQAPGKRIPPPPSFSPPSLPDTDNLLTVYSRNRSASSSRSVSPVPNITDTDQVTDTPISDEKVVTNKEIKQTVDIKFTKTSTKEQKKELNPQVLDIKTQPHEVGKEERTQTNLVLQNQNRQAKINLKLFKLRNQKLTKL